MPAATYFSPHLVKKKRRDLGITQSGLASSIGRTKSTVIRYEAGQRTPSAAMLGAIATALGVPVAAFYDEKPTAADTGVVAA